MENYFLIYKQKWYNGSVKEDSVLQIILAAIAIIPATVTALSTIYLNKKRKDDKAEQERRDARSDAKSSIQNMITQDIVRAEVLGKMPENMSDIEDEYEVYHANGGNGKITRQVNEYKEWYKQFKPSKDDPKRIDRATRPLPESACFAIDRKTAAKLCETL